MLPWSIPLRYQIYALAAAAFVLGLLRWRSRAVEDALDIAREEQRQEVERALREQRKVRDEIEILDDVDLYSRASRWVRNSDD
jgi:hypothetical protein